MSTYYNQNYSSEIKSYLEEISKVKLLTSEEERAISIAIREGDTKAKEKLINANLRFVVKTAKKFLNCGLDFADLISEGNLGLIRAVESFDPDRGFRFISYAVYWIRQSIIKAISEKSKLVRIPLNLNNTLVTIRKKLNNTTHQNITDADIEKIAAELSINKIDIIQLISIKDPISLDKNNDDDEKFSQNGLNLLATEKSPEKTAMQSDLLHQIEELLRLLPPTEADVLRLRFGINSGKTGRKTLSEIGKMKNLSKERVRQIEEKGLKRLRDLQETKNLHIYIA